MKEDDPKVDEAIAASLMRMAIYNACRLKLSPQDTHITSLHKYYQSSNSNEEDDIDENNNSGRDLPGSR